MRKFLFNACIILTILFNSTFLSAAVYSTYPPKGTIEDAEVIYKDADEVTILAGYGECNGNYWEITASQDLSVATLISGISEDVVYIYIDDSASYYPTPALIASLDEPLWSDVKRGWYRQSTGNENDRCIGVAYVNATPSVLMPMTYIGNNKYVVKGTTYKTLQTDGVPNDGWKDTTISAADYSPVNASALFIMANNRDTLPSYSSCSVAISSYDNQSNRLGEYSWGDTYNFVWVEGHRNWSRRVKWQGAANDNPWFLVRMDGFQIDR